MIHSFQVGDTVFVGTSPETIGRITGFRTDITNGQRIALVAAGSGEMHAEPTNELKRAPNFIFASGSINALGENNNNNRRFFAINLSGSNHGH
ncbi:hypothetical protein [Undibacterium curvum]|uniref:hypothetical protein n=1 Tax=Undibacterium curvum TaxID=2762294 RepID=UPI003D13DD9F